MKFRIFRGIFDKDKFDADVFALKPIYRLYVIIFSLREIKNDFLF